MKQKFKKGVTLAEICVVLAVISIVSTMVISFSLMVNKRVAAAKVKLDIISELSVSESLVESWVDKLTLAGAEFSTDGSSLSASIDETVYTCRFDGESFTGLLPDGDDISFTTETVKNITFDISKKENDIIFFCSITYSFPYGNSEKEETVTFCVNPYIGDTLS